MRKVVVLTFVSLDGVMEDPGGAEDFKYGGWACEFSRGEEGDKFKYDEVLESEAFLLGRVTYDGFADAWPEREGDFADRFNNMRKYVVGSKADASRWTGMPISSVRVCPSTVNVTVCRSQICPVSFASIKSPPPHSSLRPPTSMVRCGDTVLYAMPPNPA